MYIQTGIGIGQSGIRRPNSLVWVCSEFGRRNRFSIPSWPPFVRESFRNNSEPARSESLGIVLPRAYPLVSRQKKEDSHPHLRLPRLKTGGGGAGTPSFPPLPSPSPTPLPRPFSSGFCPSPPALPSHYMAAPNPRSKLCFMAVAGLRRVAVGANGGGEA